MKSILVTGGAGFIGSHLCESLLKKPTVKKVVVVDNLDPTTYDPKFKKENLSLLTPSKKFKFYKTDIRDRKSLEKIFKKEKPEYVVHLAAKTDTRNSVHEPEAHEDVNVLGTINLLELSKDLKVKKFIFISSSSVYGNSAKPPFKETDMINKPLAPYGATKIAGEVLSHTYYFNHGLEVACLRLFNAYGPRLRPSLVLYKWVESILNGRPVEMSGTGVRKRDFTYVGDIVRSIELAMSKSKGFEIYNIGNSKPASLKELLRMVEKVTGKKATIKSRPSTKPSVEVTYANTNKAKRLLGWEPKVSMEKGVSNFVDWFRKNRLHK
jgi:UDP-glucuronate 4-epimerase